MDRALRTPRAKRQKNTHNDNYAELGGVKHFYELGLEHGRLRVYGGRPTRTYCLKVSELIRGPGLIRVIGRDAEDVAYSVWLFGNANGSFIDDSVLLDCFNDSKVCVLISCWPSKVGGNLLVEKVLKPSPEYI